MYGDNGALLTTSKSFTIRASEKKKFYVKRCEDRSSDSSKQTDDSWTFSSTRPTKGLELFERKTCVENVRESNKLWRTAWFETRVSVKSAWWELKIEKCASGNIMLGVGLAKALSKQNSDSKKNQHFTSGSDPLSYGWIGHGKLWDFHRGKQRSRLYGLPVISPKTPLKSNDIVRVTIQEGKVSYAVNGTPCKGVAFELPLDAFVYPGVSLYDKGDRVSVLRVMEGNAKKKQKSRDRKKSVLKLENVMLTFGNTDDEEHEEKDEQKIQLEQLPEDIRSKVVTLTSMGFAVSPLWRLYDAIEIESSWR